VKTDKPKKIDEAVDFLFRILSDGDKFTIQHCSIEHIQTYNNCMLGKFIREYFEISSGNNKELINSFQVSDPMEISNAIIKMLWVKIHNI